MNIFKNVRQFFFGISNEDVIEYINRTFKVTEAQKDNVKDVPTEDTKTKATETKVEVNVEINVEPVSQPRNDPEDEPAVIETTVPEVPEVTEEDPLAFINNRCFTMEDAERRGCLPQTEPGTGDENVFKWGESVCVDSPAELNNQRQADYDLLVKDACAKIDRDLRIENAKRKKRLDKKLKKAARTGVMPTIELKDIPFKIKDT